jgi:hypothetical protein
MNTILVSAFPGTGKTYLTMHNDTGLVISDSDSSRFPKDNFPANYIEHIKKRIGYVDVILVSSHKEVRDALVKEGLGFSLLYPTKDSKEEFLRRYAERKNTESFIELLNENWDLWLDELGKQEGCTRVQLPAGLYVKDAVLALLEQIKTKEYEAKK